MARSTCVYVVLKRGRPKAGFTVKHELISWLQRHPDDSFKIWRLADNPHESSYYPSKPPADITEEIRGSLSD